MMGILYSLLTRALMEIDRLMRDRFNNTIYTRQKAYKEQFLLGNLSMR